MSIYYTQILNTDARKILSGGYSAAGSPLKSDTSLLKELKQTISSVPLEDEKIFTLASKSGDCVFYFRMQNGLLACAITDKRTGSKEATVYLNDLLAQYRLQFGDAAVPHYEFDDNIRDISDGFNKKLKVSKGVEELEDAHSALVENLDTLINRGENINNLKDLADKVNFETREMSRKVNQIKRNAQIEKYKIYGVVALIIFIIIYFFFL